MHALLSLSKKIDAFSEWVGRWVAWLLLFAVLISAANAVVDSVRSIAMVKNSPAKSMAWQSLAL